MKKFLKGLLVLALIAGVAYPVFAAWNLRQNGDGTADFVRTMGTTEITAPVGQVHLTAYMADVSTLSTVAVAVPITGAELTYIQSAVAGQITGTDTKIFFYHFRNGANLGEITNGTARLTIAASTGPSGVATGDVDAFTPSAAATDVNRLQRGDTIIIQSDGGSTYTIASTFTLVFDPR